MIGLWLPLVAGVAWWLGGAAEPQAEVVETSPRPAWIGADALEHHVAAALATPLAYSWGELREMVAILDHRLQPLESDRLALVVLSLLPVMAARARSGEPAARAWFAPGAGRFALAVPPYPPPPPSVYQ